MSMADTIAYVILGVCVGVIVLRLVRPPSRGDGSGPSLTWRGNDKGWQWTDRK